MMRSRLYKLERLRHSAIVKGDRLESFNIEGEIARMSASSPQLRSHESQAFGYVQQAYIPKDLIREISYLNEDALPRREIEPMIEDCRAFVSDKLRVDISGVQIVRVNLDLALCEAQAASCGDTEHLVLLPLAATGFQAPDILVHELGHTAEFTLRRSIGEDRFLAQHSFLSETVAHYCQYRYLKEFGTPQERLGAMGSIVKEYLGLKAVLASYDLERRDEDRLLIHEICAHEYVSDFVEIYGRNVVGSILKGYDQLSIGHIYKYHVEPRFGAMLAMHLIDQPEKIRDLAMSEANKPIATTLREMNLDAELLLDFSRSGDIMWNFVDS